MKLEYIVIAASSLLIELLVLFLQPEAKNDRGRSASNQSTGQNNATLSIKTMKR
jgi:hypothetical protein